MSTTQETDPRLSAPLAGSLDSPTATLGARRSSHSSPNVAELPRAPRIAASDIARTFDVPDELVVPPTLEPRPEWATDRLSPLAAVLHSLACACKWGGDVEGHGADFEDLADAVREGVLADHPAGEPVRYPVEAKVWAGTWGTLGATVALALVTLLLDRLDVIPTLFAGEYPWVGGVVMALSVVLPPVAQFIRAYLAEHSPRPSQLAQERPARPGAGIRVL